ncbi:MAG TPA: alpha/beta hydrolase-fold protein, partial [Blastocatellia bacterium]|nr:alpha/beta hydrolase-fold protein [Blastocatellia bacterium]
MIKRALLILLFAALAHSPASSVQSTSMEFEVSVADGLISGPQNGRLFIILNPRSSPEPRFALGRTGLDAAPVAARDVNGLAPGSSVVIDQKAVTFPVESLSQIPAGEYFVQALFDSNIDLKSLNAPGNLYSEVQRLRLDPARAGRVKIKLTRMVPAEQTPADTEYVKYVKIESPLLSRFHGRPIYLRAGVILPKGYASEPVRRYPLRVSIGGYGASYTVAGRMMAEGSEFRRMWLADDTPRMILLQLDGDGPFGDCYQVNSANNGPYGDALIEELIPYVEKQYRAVGQPYSRVLDGGSTGGWVSLALQVFYPDFFNGTWSGYPDGVDFRALQLIDIYKDENAYVNRHGFERPGMRDLNGETRFTIRHECRMENVMGRGDSYTMSGGQWGAWNATYGPRGEDGRPVPLWDAVTGKINRQAAEHWKKYDLRSVMEQNWKTLGPKLRGKIHIWVGEADE